MAPVLPRTRVATLEFFETRLPVWGAAPAAIGLRPLDIAQLTDLTEAARAAHDEAERLRAQAAAAADAARLASEAMRARGAGMVRVIKAYADNKDDPNIYAAAQINPPVPPTRRPPLAPPGRPELARPELNSDGSVTLRWKADNAMASRGAYFVIVRTLPDEAERVIGDAAGRTFTDRTLPRGTASATYMIIPKRGARSGEPSARVTVQLGVDNSPAAARARTAA